MLRLVDAVCDNLVLILFGPTLELAVRDAVFVYDTHLQTKLLIPL